MRKINLCFLITALKITFLIKKIQLIILTIINYEISLDNYILSAFIYKLNLFTNLLQNICLFWKNVNI